MPWVDPNTGDILPEYRPDADWIDPLTPAERARYQRQLEAESRARMKGDGFNTCLDCGKPFGPDGYCPDTPIN